MSTIEWVRNADGSPGKTWNPIRARHVKTGKRGWHCEPVCAACAHCYAERLNMKAGDTGGTGLAFKPGHRGDVSIFLDEKTLAAPLRWKKPQRIFVCSMTDLFGAWVKRAWLDRIFAVMALCPQHTFIVLTKRPAAMREYLAESLFERIAAAAVDVLVAAPITRLHVAVTDDNIGWPLPNVWGLVSCGDQADADAFIPILLATPLAKRGVSCEPLLGPIDLGAYLEGREDHGVDLSRAAGSKVGGCTGWRPPLDWVIAGGESGTAEQAVRPMHPDWLRGLRAQCDAADVAFFFKQWGGWCPEIDRDRDDPDWRQPYVRYKQPHFRMLNLAGGHGFHGERLHVMRRCSKKSAGRALDGRSHDAWPDDRGEQPILRGEGRP